MQFITIRASEHVNPKSECFYHFVYSDTEYSIIHDHDYYEIFLTVSGEIIHLVNGKQQKLHEGSLVFIRPNDKHTLIRIPDEHATFINLSLSCNSVKLLFEYLSDDFPSNELLSQLYPPTKQLAKIDKEWVAQQLKNCNAIYWQKPEQLKIHTRVMLAQIFLKYFSNFTKNDNNETPIWLENLCNQMKKPDNFCAGIDRMIELSGKSREHLARCMKKYMNTTTTDFINEQRMSYAANMLVHSSIQILELCFDTGFQNECWFYTQFKKKYGISPSKYRKKFSVLG